MKKFIFSITGNDTLSNTLGIEIKSSWRDVFELHTCFNSLDLPEGLMEKAAFLAALEVIVNGSGYNTA